MTCATFAPTAPRHDGFWRRLGWSLWPPRCLICGETGANGRDLCAICTAAWPWMGPACLRCALPLPDPCGASATPGPNPAGDALPTRAICGRCLRRPLLLTEVHAACAYRAPLDRLLPRFKFHRDLAAGRLLAAMLCERLAVPLHDGWEHHRASPPLNAHPRASPPPADPLAHAGHRRPTPCASTDATMPSPPVLIPIPLHRTRLRERGYDQALEIARPLARELRLPLLSQGLIRRRDTPAQSRLDAAHRRRNLQGAFAWRETVPVPAYVVLVDDVMTTGATLQAAARTLRRAGVQRVDAWVCARVL
ncbi:ComF family protein [Lysobacter sp. CA199]|uniref:ComF family protein n=1 Tax=Lysobacter sp. CA199 TaxID=3455608 RepID=UPI003F8D8C7E